MTTTAQNSTSSSQGNSIHDDPMSSSILAVAVASGVIVGLLLGWITLEASFRARRQFAAWLRWKMGFEAKEGDQAQAGIRASQSAVWDAKENGYTTPKRDAQTSDSLPLSVQGTLVEPASPGIAKHQSNREAPSTAQMEAIPSLRTPQKVHSAASPASHYSYYNVEDLSTPRGQFAISERKPSLESVGSDATPTKGSYQARIEVPKRVQTKLNRI